MRRWAKRILAFLFIAGAINMGLLGNSHVQAGDGSGTPVFDYPTTGSSHYLYASKGPGNGIYLNAPYSYLKARYNSDAAYYDIDITDACYHTGIDGGTTKPTSCELGQVEIHVCASDNTGEFQVSYKGNKSKCFRYDPGAAGANGAGTHTLRFRNGSGGADDGQLIMPDVNGRRYLFVIVEMRVLGANAFKVRSVARNSSLAAAGDTRIGLGGQLTYPLAVGRAPLNGTTSETFRFDQKIPCTPTRDRFHIEWFDADRPPSTTPRDDNITWSMRNMETNQSLSSGQYAFIRGMSESAYLGGQDALHGEDIINNPNLRVREGDRFQWTWSNVDGNNGVQVKLPFSEVDDLECGKPRITVSITDCRLFTFRADTTTGSSYDARLIVDGVDRDLKQNIDDDTEGSFDISGYMNAYHEFQVRARDRSTGLEDTSAVINNEDCLDEITDAFCPLYEEEFGEDFERYQDVSPPDTTPYDPPPSGYAGSPGATDTENVPQGQYELTAAYDQYNPRTNIPWDPTGKNPPPFTLDYQNFRDYPYDSHRVTYQYRSYYDRYRWTASSSPSYSYSDNNDDGDTSDAGERTFLGYAWGGRTRINSNLTANGSANAPTLPECYHRGFEMTPTFNNIQWDDIEEVTQLSIGSSVSTEYIPDPNAPSNQLRNPNRVEDAQVDVEIILYHSDGRPPQAYPLPRDNSCNNEFSDGEFTTPGSLTFNTVNTNSVDCRRAEIPPLAAGDYACVTISFDFTRGTMDQTGEVQSSNTPMAIPDPPGDNANEIGCTTWLVNRPYFTVLGGDVSVGSPFAEPDGQCTTAVTVADISAWNRGTRAPSSVYPNSRFGGAGTTLAAYAAGAIEDFSTATRRNNPGPMDGLAFANEGGTGNWSTNNFTCLPNYAAEATGAPPTTGNLGALDPTAESFSTTGAYTITTSAIGNGRRIAIFADSVQINGNITINKTGYNSIEDIPAVRIVARNIYIHPDVTNIDATLIAQGGDIYTCSNGGANNPTDDSIANGDCRDNNLVVRGSLIANRVNLTRGIGSLRRSHRNNDYTLGGVTPNVAERIIYTPSMWLTNFSTRIQEEAPYDAFTSMPPIL